MYKHSKRYLDFKNIQFSQFVFPNSFFNIYVDSCPKWTEINTVLEFLSRWASSSIFSSAFWWHTSLFLHFKHVPVCQGWSPENRNSWNIFKNTVWSSNILLNPLTLMDLEWCVRSRMALDHSTDRKLCSALFCRFCSEFFRTEAWITSHTENPSSCEGKQR